MKYFKSFLLTLLLLSVVTAKAAPEVITFTSSEGTYVTSGGNYVAEINFATNPAIKITASANNMDKRVTGDHLLWHSGTSGSSTYTISVGDGYSITEFSVTGEANTAVQTLTSGSTSQEFAVGTSTTFTVTGLSSATASYVQTGNNASGMKITGFSVTVVKATDEQTAAAEKVAGWLDLLQSQALVTDVSNYVSNARQQDWEGDYASLLDKNNSTYFHSAWGGTMATQPNHDLQARLPEAVEKFHIFYVTRSTGTGYPTAFRIDGSNNAEDFSEAGGSGWTDNVASVTENLPAGASKSYLSGVITMKNPYQYLRFVPSIGNNQGKYWFCLAEFWLFPSNDAIDEAIALMKDLPAAAFLTDSQIREINRLDNELRSTTVAVTYELYKSDGTTLIGSETVSQQKNSAVNVPATLKTKEYYYDYTTEGTIGNTACVIKVTRTLKDPTIVESLADLSNDKVYFITTNENKRKSLSTYTTDGRTYLASEAKSELKLDPKKFAIINYEDNFYLYSVEDQKFVLSGSGAAISLADMVKGTTDRVTFTQTAEPLWMPKFNDENSKIINTSPSRTYAIVVDNWGSSTNQWDDGCQYTLHEAGDFDPQPVLDALQEFFHPDPMAECLALATDVLNQVPYSLFPKNFNWDQGTETVKDKKGKEVEVPVKGMSGADYNRTFKIYKNMAGKYQLASRLYVAILARLVEYVDADELAKEEIIQYLEKLYEEKGEPVPDVEEVIADALRYYARCVVESHGIGAALYEQNDPNYSRMYDAITGNPNADGSKLSYAYWWLYYGYDWRADDGLDVTLSDTYEMIHQFIGLGYFEYYSGRNYFGFDPTLTAHILDPNLENVDAWNVSGDFATDGGQSLTDAETTMGGGNSAGAVAGNDYAYLTLTGAGKGDASQTITLPAGRYMLTVAGRASVANQVEKTAVVNGETITGKTYEGPFTEAGAHSPDRFFQLYAKNAQGESAQSIVPQVGLGESAGVFGYGWNDASLFFTMPSLGEVTLGVRAQTDVKGAKASFTRFRLTRLGDPTLFFDEYQTYETELNWDPTSFFFGTAPVDVVVHKKLTPGKWQSIAVPVDLSAEELLENFGEGTKLAVPTAMVEIDPEEKEMLVNFTSWDVAASKQGLVQTKIYGNGFDWWTDEYGYYFDYPAGMIANVPYLINPAKVNANNMYVFHNVTSSDTHGMRYTLNEEDDEQQVLDAMSTLTGWSWGGFGIADDEDGLYFFSEQVENPELPGVVFRPNYKYTKGTSDNYTIEFSSTQNAFSGEFACKDGYKVVSAWIDGSYEIVTDQLDDMLAAGKKAAERYSGIPTAMEEAMTFDPQIEGETGPAGFLNNYTDGVVADDNKSWTTKDGKITVTADDETSSIYYNEDTNDHFLHQQLMDHYLWFTPGKYTIKANNPFEYIYGYKFSNLWADTNDDELTFTKSNGEVVSLGSGYGYIDNPKEIAETGIIESSVSFVLNGDEDAALALGFEFDLLYVKEYTDYSMVEFLMFLNATKNVRNAMIEAKNAYPLSKEFHKTYAEAENLLNSEHTELVEGADAAFKQVLSAYLAAFNQKTKADDIPALTEKLREEIEKYKTQIDQGKLTAGKYVFLNVGSGKYLGGGNLWGTQASLTTHGELMEMSLLEDGKYTIESRFTNGNNYHAFGKDAGGNYYMDVANSTALDIIPQGNGLFTINDGDGLLGYDGESTVLAKGLTDAGSDKALWRILSEDDLKVLMNEASVEKPVDVTFFIQDPNFSRNHRDLNAWSFTWSGGNCRLSATTTGYENQPDKHINFSAEAGTNGS